MPSSQPVQTLYRMIRVAKPLSVRVRQYITLAGFMHQPVMFGME
jgi:hypothetical protein